MNNKEFDQFLRGEVDSINYGGGEQAWEQFSAAKVDQQIKSEVEAIKYPDGEIAWKQFSAQHSGEQSPRRRFAYWRPLVAAASIAILVGVLLHHSASDIDDLHTRQVAGNSTSVEAPTVTTIEGTVDHKVIASEVAQTLTPQVKPIDKPSASLQAESQVEHPITSIAKHNTFAQAQSLNSVVVTAVNAAPLSSRTLPSTTEITIPIAKIPVVKVDDTPTLVRNSNATVASMNSLPTLAINELTQSLAFTSVEKQLDIQPSKKKRFNLFGEIGIGSHQSGIRFLTGVSIPMNSWSVETGLGLMDKSNRPMYFSQELQSSVFPDFQEYHDYTFIQKVTMILPLRIKKRIWKRHNIIASVQGSYNFSNQVDIESIVPNATPQIGPGVSTGGVFSAEIDLGKEVYKYNNIGSAANAYSVVTFNRMNLDIIAGYELDLSRVSIGVSMAKPVFSSFRITDGIDGPVLFHMLENPSINLSLKYTFI